MKDQPWNLNQTWPVGWKWCWFTNAPKCFGAFPQIRGKKKQIFTTFRYFCTRHHISLERNVPSTNQNASIKPQCVPEKLTHFLWPLTQKWLRYVLSFSPTLLATLRCSHHCCNMSSFIWFYMLVCVSCRVVCDCLSVCLSVCLYCLGVSGCCWWCCGCCCQSTQWVMSLFV